MSFFLDLAKKRRSIRRYEQHDIDDATLERILEAARFAPSGNNSQPWRFIVVRDRAIKKKLFTAAEGQVSLTEAPVTIAVIGDISAKLKPEFASSMPSADDPRNVEALIKTVRDATIAADHLVMAATDEGLGSLWISQFKQERMRPVLGIPENAYVVTLIALGTAREKPEATPRHPLQTIVFAEQFGRHLAHEEDTL